MTLVEKLIVLKIKINNYKQQNNNKIKFIYLKIKIIS